MDLDNDQQYSSFQDIQHLNIDLCLELILPYLNVQDLANCADTSKQMRRAAEIIFAHKYGRTLFDIGEKNVNTIRVYLNVIHIKM